MGKRKFLNMAQERTIGRLRDKFDTIDYTVPSISKRGTARVRFKLRGRKKAKIVHVSKKGNVR